MLIFELEKITIVETSFPDEVCEILVYNNNYYNYEIFRETSWRLISFSGTAMNS